MPSFYTCIIIEDEPLAVTRLEKMLEKTGHPVRVIGHLESVEQALRWFSSNPAPDFILSDVQLGDGISFQVFEKMQVECPVIFTTSYDEYAIRAFKLQSIDYLLKPVKQEELKAALDKFIAQKGQAGQPWAEFQQQMMGIMNQLDPGSKTKYKERLLVRQADQLIPVEVAEIAYFFTRNDWVCIRTREGREFLVDFRLDELEGMLDPSLFFRLNRQFLASAGSLRKAYNHLNGKLKVDLDPVPDEEVFVSREKAGGFKSWWESAL
jgi:DNA-binding LytR/AlgR family response regulator